MEARKWQLAPIVIDRAINVVAVTDRYRRQLIGEHLRYSHYEDDAQRGLEKPLVEFVFNSGLDLRSDPLLDSDTQSELILLDPT